MTVHPSGTHFLDGLREEWILGDNMMSVCACVCVCACVRVYKSYDPKTNPFASYHDVPSYKVINPPITFNS